MSTRDHTDDDRTDLHDHPAVPDHLADQLGERDCTPDTPTPNATDHPDDTYRVAGQRGVAVHTPGRKRPCADAAVTEHVLDPADPDGVTARAMMDTTAADAFIVADESVWCPLEPNR